MRMRHDRALSVANTHLQPPRLKTQIRSRYPELRQFQCDNCGVCAVAPARLRLMVGGLELRRNAPDMIRVPPQRELGELLRGEQLARAKGWSMRKAPRA